MQFTARIKRRNLIITGEILNIEVFVLYDSSLTPGDYALYAKSTAGNIFLDDCDLEIQDSSVLLALSLLKICTEIK